MRLDPSSPSKFGRKELSVGSPNKSGRQNVEDGESGPAPAPGSPLKKSNKENTPPSGRSGKEPLLTPTTPTTHAAFSRQELYQSRDTSEVNSRNRYGPTRGLSAEDLEKLNLPKVKRLANVTQICMRNRSYCPDLGTDLCVLDFLDYYFDLLNYVHQRDLRREQFDVAYPKPDEPTPEYEAARAKYLGRERANLRKRRTRLRHGDFQILTQVGQGGYGQVYLASKKDTKEVCALKVMSKKLLFKLDEIRHILTERDILTAAKSEWLVKLLYAFQDDKSIYLAMVSP